MEERSRKKLSSPSFQLFHIERIGTNIFTGALQPWRGEIFGKCGQKMFI